MAILARSVVVANKLLSIMTSVMLMFISRTIEKLDIDRPTSSQLPSSRTRKKKVRLIMSEMSIISFISDE